MYSINNDNNEQFSKEYLKLNSCGIDYINTITTHSFIKNGRIDYHMIYIYKGKCYLKTDDREITVNAGGVILFRPFERQDYCFKKEDGSIACFLNFTGSKCNAYLEKIGFKNNSVIYTSPNDKIIKIFEKITREFTIQKTFSQEFMIAYLIEIFCEIGRNHLQLNDTSSEKEFIIDSVCLLIKRNYQKNLPIKFYSDFCNLSESRFFHLFKEVKNETPNSYITRIKIEKAKEFLTYYNLSIKEIANLTGFIDQNYFSRAFKKYAKMSPTKFKNENS